MERMDELLEQDALQPAHVRAVAAALADRHARAPTAPDEAPGLDFYRGALEPLAAGGRRLDAARGRVEAGLTEQADRLLARAGDGRILAAAVELAPEDVSFGPDDRARVAPAAGREIGIPFDAALELASLSVWLARYGRADLSERLVSHYANVAGDYEIYRVLDFYESFCALRQQAASGAQSAAPLPDPTARSPLARPVVVAMSGSVASGKSALARALADALAAPLVVADRIRDHLVHGVAGRPVHEAGWADGFEPGFGPRVYAEMLRRGEIVLQTGRAVVLDACFPASFERAGARALAQRHGAPFLLVECHVDPEVQRRRLVEREEGQDAGDWQAIAAALAARTVPAVDIADAERLEVDTSGRLETSLEPLLDRIAGNAPA